MRLVAERPHSRCLIVIIPELRLRADCMQLGFYVSIGGDGTCSFSPDNVAKILADPDNVGWFGAEPGQRCAQ